MDSMGASQTQRGGKTLTVPSKSGEGLAVHRMRVASSVEVRSSSVNGVMNGKGSLVVDHPFRATALNNAAVGADEKEVGNGHVAEGNTKGVDPEVILPDRVTEGQVTSHTLIEAEHTEDAECLCETLLAAALLLLRGVVGDRL